MPSKSRDVSSTAAQGTPFVSQIVLGFGMRCERRKSMAEIDLNGEIHQKTEKRHVKTQNPWHTKMQHLSPAREIYCSEHSIHFLPARFFYWRSLSQQLWSMDSMEETLFCH